LVLRNNWGSGAPADIDGSGAVDALDYALLKANWYKAGDPQ
jgi:hypothetical protein